MKSSACAAAGKKFVNDAGKELRDLPQAAGEQRVGVAPLRDAAARQPVDRELVPVEDRDLLEVVGEDTRGRQAAHAPPDDDGVFTVLATHGGPPDEIHHHYGQKAEVGSRVVARQSGRLRLG